jgi:alcohol dehydrogenase (cytochrome c)
MSPSYDPSTGTFFVTTREVCQIYVGLPPAADYQSGDRVMGGTIRRSEQPSWGGLKAIDPITGTIRWEVRHATPAWGGVLSTEGGVVFSGNAEGEFFAADSRTGTVLFRTAVGAPVYAAPTTFEIDGRQYLTIAAGTAFTAFALPE